MKVMGRDDVQCRHTYMDRVTLLQVKMMDCDKQCYDITGLYKGPMIFG